MHCGIAGIRHGAFNPQVSQGMSPCPCKVQSLKTPTLSLHDTCAMQEHPCCRPVHSFLAEDIRAWHVCAHSWQKIAPYAARGPSRFILQAWSAKLSLLPHLSGRTWRLLRDRLSRDSQPSSIPQATRRRTCARHTCASTGSGCLWLHALR